MAAISGRRLIELREAAGYETQQALAKKARMDPSKLSRLENEKPVNLTLTSLERLAKTLKVPLAELFIAPRPEGDSGHVSTGERNQILDERFAGLLTALDAEAPAADSWRGDILKAIAALNRALRRDDSGEVDERAAKARR